MGRAIDYALNHHVLAISRSDYALTVNPLLNLGFGSEAGNRNLLQNTRGFWLEGRIGRNFTFQSALWEQLGHFPSYLLQQMNSPQIPGLPVVPGQGIARPLESDFWDGALDYGMASGMVSYRPNRYFHFSLGHGKNFLGEGYRSLFLSDNAFNYPYFKIETRFWRIKYVNLWAGFMDLGTILPSGQFAKKYGAFHYLDFAVTNRWHLQFFEGTILGDSTFAQGFDLNFFNPVIFYRSVEFSVGSEYGNATMGFGSTYQFGHGGMVYGQFLLDEFNMAALRASQGSWLNKFGWQLGAKMHEPLGWKNGFVRLEWNAVRPYTYSHRNPLTNYGHYAQPLAHPWGANFHEVILQGAYTVGRYRANIQLNLGVVGRDSTGQNWGGNIYRSYNTREQDDNNSIGQGQSGTLFMARGELSYTLNPLYNLEAYGLLQYRKWSGASAYDVPESTYFILGIRTRLWNYYYDR